jgi:hypothetical protein
VDPLDFELSVRAVEADYVVNVLQSPTGEATSRLALPFGQAALESQLHALEDAIAASTLGRRRLKSSDEERVQAFGTALFDSLFAGDVRSAFDFSRREAIRLERPLRVRLCFDVAGLAALPWEFMYDPREGDFLCLCSATPMVRYLEIAQPLKPLTVSPPLRILGLVCSPSDMVALDTDQEQRRLEHAIGGLRERGVVELHWLKTPSWRDLQRELHRGPWHLFHFVGHGGFENGEGVLALLDENGRSDHIGATNLARLLGDHFPLRLAVLNACEGARGSQTDVFSSTAATLVRRGIPAVLAMQYSITDRAAIEVSRTFYEAIAEGIPVDAAVTEARKAVSLAMPQSLEWGIPVLYTHAPDGMLFQLRPPPIQPNIARDDAREPVGGEGAPKRPSRARRVIVMAGTGLAALALIGLMFGTLRGHGHVQSPSAGYRFGGYAVQLNQSPGVHPSLDQQQLNVVLPAAAPTEEGGVTTECAAAGDFDVQVTYTLKFWPTRNAGRVGVAASNTAVERISEPDGEYYAVQNESGAVTKVPTTDGTGELRLVRNGRELTGFERNSAGDRWTSIFSSSGPDSPAHVTVHLWSDAASAQERSASFGEFAFTHGSCR